MDALSAIWNEDGTPKRPGVDYTPVDTPAFLEAAQREVREKTAPSVGDVVHFWDCGACRAAMVMETYGDHSATLRVHIPHRPFEDWSAGHDETREEESSWHWGHV